MHLLFVCNQNRHRSVTAEEVFKDAHETRSRGLFGGRQLSGDDLSWADLVIVMEEIQREEIGKRFPKAYLRTRIVSADIPDIYAKGQPELVELLKERISDLLEPPTEL